MNRMIGVFILQLFFVAQLHAESEPAERSRLVTRIDAAVSAMNELFNALLDMSKLDAGMLEVNLTDFPVERLFKQMETTFAGAAREKGLGLSVSSSRAWVRSDFILLERILLNLVSEGSWDLLEKLAQEQAAALDFSIEKRRALLLSYLALQSSTAAQLLLRTDFAFALKKLEDSMILTLLAALKQKTDEGTKFCTESLRSPRSDPILQAAKKWAPAQPEKGVAAVPTSNRFHVVKERETLWKIARQYKVKVDELVRLNNLEKDSLFPGMTLKLPQGTGSEPPP